MGQFIASVDQGSVNELFVKAYNAWPVIDLPAQGANQAFNAGPFSGSVALSLTSQAQRLAFAAGAQPIDLRTTASNPPVAYSGLGWRVHCNVQGNLHVANFNLGLGLGFDTDVLLAGGAQISVAQQPGSFQARLQLTVSDITLSFASQRAAVVNAAQNLAQQVDTSPLPGVQHLPQAAINALGNAAGMAFDLVAGPAAAAAAQLIRNRLNALQLQLTAAIPDSYALPVPGLQTPLSIHLSQLQLGIGGERVTLSATFA